MTDGSRTAGPLDGIRVLDFATERAELAGRLLADLGAEVLKIEPQGGSAARRMPPFILGRETDPEGSLYWAAVALGKRSAVLALDTAEGRAQAARLAAGADILIESDDPGVMDALGLGYEALRERNPGLIYVSVTPYGQAGPHALRPASELTLEAAGGLLGLQGDGDRPPVPVGYPQAAFHAGAQAAADAVIALNARDRTGFGQHLDVSTQAAVVWTLMNATGYPPNTGGDPPHTSETRRDAPPELAPGVAFPGIWPCKDGYVQMTTTLSGLGGRTLGNLFQLMEAEGALSPGLQGTGWSAWVETIAPGQVAAEVLAAARDEIARYFLSRTKEELMERAVAHKLLLAPIRTLEELPREPQLQARGYWRELGGRMYPGPAVRFSRTPMEPAGPSPTLGEHQRLANASPWPAAPARNPRGAPGSRAFEGLKVADFAWVGVGPIIAKALADHGATVVHVESASRPDVLRLGPPFKNNEAGLDRSQFQANFNSSKLGLALNFTMPGARDVALRLIEWADVVVESFTPGVLVALGLDYEQVSRGRPDLIMLSTCLCGQTGPYATYRGFGTQGSALSGLHGLTGWPDRAPRGTWGAYTDFIAPRYGVVALAAAIFEHHRSGLGQYIDLGQVEAAIHFAEPALLDFTVNGRTRSAAGHTSERSCPHGVYQAAGKERYVAVSTETQVQWETLARMAGLDAVVPLTADLVERFAVTDRIDAALADWCRGQDPWALAARLAEAGVPAAVVQRPSDLYNDPQLAARGFFVTCEHGVMGPTPYDGPATLFSATPPRLTAAPVLGEHTGEVLRDILGFSDDEIAELAAADVLV